MVRIPSFIVFSVAVCGALALSAASAVADGDGHLNQSVSTSGPVPTKPGDPPKHWSKQTEATCGMACRYHRANDNLTMQALYLMTKIQGIDTAIAAGKDTEARTALGAFCKTATEDLDTCSKRYKDFQRIALVEIRQAIGKNEDSIARLTTGRRADGTVADETALAFETGEEQKPYIAEVPTLSELEASYIKGTLKENGTTYSAAEIRKWSQTLIVNNPKERYLQFSEKAAVGNPYQQETSSYSVYMQHPDGGADARALKIYEKSKKSIEDFADTKKKDIDNGVAKVHAPTKNLKKEDSVSYEAFVHARSVINTKIVDDTQRTDSEEKERKLASDAKDPKPIPTPGSTDAALPPGINRGVARDVKITTGGTARQNPSKFKDYGPDDVVTPPPEMKNSRYIKYDLNDIIQDVENVK